MNRKTPLLFCAAALCAAFCAGCTRTLPEQKSAELTSSPAVRSVTDSQKLDVFAAAERDLAEQRAAYEAEMKRLQPQIRAFEAKRKANPGKRMIAPYRLPWKPDLRAWTIYPEALVRNPKARNVKPLASDEKAIGGFRYELKVPVHIYSTGKYKLWFRHFQTENLHANILIRLVAPNTETVRFVRFDWNIGNSSRPYEGLYPKRPGNRFLWSSIDLEIERPGDYLVCMKSDNHGMPRGGKKGYFAVNGMYLSNDPAFHPETNPVLAKAAGDVFPVPAGFQAARIHAPSTDLNTSIADHQKRLLTSFHECYPAFHDTAYLIQLGAVCDSYVPEHARKFNMPGQFGANFDIRNTDFEWRYPIVRKNPKDPKSEIISAPGRAAGTDGKPWRNFSYAFEPYRTACYENSVRSLKELAAGPDNDLYSMMWTAWEQCGNYDYSETSIRGYREFLKKMYGNIDKLNRTWHTAYRGFDEIVPSKFSDCIGKERIADPFKRAQATANFIDFRDYCSKTYASWVALKTKSILENDPLKRRVMSNLSANNISSVMWLQWRPLSYEDTCQITNRGVDYVGYDNYGTDDLMGANFEAYDTFSDGTQKPILREGSTHAPDPYLISRTIWTLIGKGMHGFRAFTTQESWTGELQKFGMSDMFDDASPRPKLAAIADVYRSMHHLESLLTETVRKRVSKPVAIYYSSVCNTLQERPGASIFDPAPDNFQRVFEIIRGCGYPATFITDRQIREGKRLNEIQAIFFIDAKYIPTDVVEKVQEWVRNGGHIVCDAQPGIYNGHGFPADSMIRFLGIEPVRRERVKSVEAEKLSFGYSAYSFDVVNQDELYQTACEWKNQYDSNHPIARQVGKLMFSGYGVQNVKCTAGEVLISQNNGGPAWIIREHGSKGGTSSYFGGYLGTIFGAGCTTYEWRDAHSDPSPYRFLDAYLSYIGAKKVAVSDLEPEVERAMRFESPLVDSKGNAVLPMISYNRHTLPEFKVCYPLPEGVREPRMVYAAVSGSRKIVPVKFRYDRSKHAISFVMPGFRSYGNALVIHDSAPLVSVELEPGKRDAYGLADFRPGDERKARVRVFNLSGKSLRPGRLTLRLPDGWFYDREQVQIPALSGFESSPVYEFTVKAPAYITSRRVRPVNFLYESDGIKSSPAVEMVWFQKSPLNPSSPEIRVD